MSDGFRADPAQLRRHGDEFTDHAQRAGTIHGQLHDSLTQAGNCWGDDEAGRAFEAGYLDSANGTLDKLGALPGQLSTVGDNFTATAANYEQAEQDNAGAFGPGQD